MVITYYYIGLFHYYVRITHYVINSHYYLLLTVELADASVENLVAKLTRRHIDCSVCHIPDADICL